MASKRRTDWLIDEVAKFLAACPTREQLLGYRPSLQAQERAQELLDKSKSGRISLEEQWELDQFEHTETLMQLIKAHVRARKAAPS
jgi:hypothetical protein